MKISEEDFEEQFLPIKNHLDDNASFNGCMYETYGKELDFVFELSKTTKRVWTIIEGDKNTLYCVAGFHLVNRLGFLITEKPWESGLEEVKIDTDY